MYHSYFYGKVTPKMSVNRKNIHKIGVFLDTYLNFTIRIFTWDLVSNLHICKKFEKPAKHITLSNLI